METLPIWFFSFNSIRWEKKNKRATIYEEPSAPSSFISDSCLFVLCLLTHTHKQQKKNKWIAPMEIFRLDFCLFFFIHSAAGPLSFLFLNTRNVMKKKKGTNETKKKKTKENRLGFGFDIYGPFLLAGVGPIKTHRPPFSVGRSVFFFSFFFLFFFFFVCFFWFLFYSIGIDGLIVIFLSLFWSRWNWNAERVYWVFTEFLFCLYSLSVDFGSPNWLWQKVGYVLPSFTGFYWVLLGFTRFY